uniref:RNA-binding protein NOB1 n=1 Tax=Panagrellus redivivus TaxID=6233 RepID=A0A7E4W6K0_PANRE
MRRAEEVPIHHLVVDAGGFIRNAPLVDLAAKVYTLQCVLDEIRDKNTRNRLKALPFELIIRDPTPQSYSTVIKVSKQTGDYASLSSTDLKVIALTHDLHLEHIGKDSICYDVKSQKPEIVEAGKRAPIETHVPAPKTGDDAPEAGDEETAAAAAAVLEAIEKLNVDEEPQESNDSGELPDVQTDVADGDAKAQGIEQNDENSDDDDYFSDDESSTMPRIGGFGEWIDESNLLEVAGRMESAVDPTTKKMEVACFSTDFSVQNVLLHMKMNISSVDGMRVKTLRSFILRCRVCAKTTAVVSKKFCPHCGHEGLHKIGVSVDENGNQRLHINKQRATVTRGYRFSIPMPKGGKHAHDIRVTEDHLLPKARMAKFQQDPTSDAPFQTIDVTSRSALLGVRTGGRHMPRNPNELRGGRKRGGKKR